MPRRTFPMDVEEFDRVAAVETTRTFTRELGSSFDLFLSAEDEAGRDADQSPQTQESDCGST